MKNIKTMIKSHSFSLGKTYDQYIRENRESLSLQQELLMALIGDGETIPIIAETDYETNTTKVSFNGDIIQTVRMMVDASNNKLSAREVLNLEMSPDRNEASAVSIRDYLRKLQLLLWVEKADFNSKRPWGNGGWEYDIAEVLIANKIVDGSLDEDGYVENVNWDEVNHLVKELIESLYNE